MQVSGNVRSGSPPANAFITTQTRVTRGNLLLSQGYQMASFARIAAYLQAVPTPHVPLKLVSRRCLRPANHIERTVAQGQRCEAVAILSTRLSPTRPARPASPRKTVAMPLDDSRESAGSRLGWPLPNSSFAPHTLTPPLLRERDQDAPAFA
jgi:hypothetical protein